MSDAALPRPARWRLALFAAGDFAFNLYWQSVMLFLLFYYTDALGLPMAWAAASFMVASVWDGFANFAAGILADRREAPRRYRPVLMLGAVPLGLAFVLAYLPPVLGGWWGVCIVFAGHFVFRTAYALVNVPYLAMSARVSADSGDRAFVAGMRMLAGTLAVVVVAQASEPLGRWLTGSAAAAQAYLGAAIVFAALGSALLIVVGATYREPPGTPPPPPRAPIRSALASLAANRAFVTLNLAMMAVIVAVTVLNKSVLYYFKYRFGDTGAGELTLAAMGVTSAIAVPLWMLASRPLGVRAVWFAAVAAAMAGLAAFALWGAERVVAMQAFLLFLHAAIMGLHFAFWALLPGTIDYGERATGLRVEGAAFGAAALLQRVAIGVATALFGVSYGAGGYVANAAQSGFTLAVMRWTIVAVPAAFLALAWVAMRRNPMGRGPRQPLR